MAGQAGQQGQEAARGAGSLLCLLCLPSLARLSTLAALSSLSKDPGCGAGCPGPAECKRVRPSQAAAPGKGGQRATLRRRAAAPWHRGPAACRSSLPAGARQACSPDALRTPHSLACTAGGAQRQWHDLPELLRLPDLHLRLSAIPPAQPTAVFGRGQPTGVAAASYPRRAPPSTHALAPLPCKHPHHAHPPPAAALAVHHAHPGSELHAFTLHPPSIPPTKMRAPSAISRLQLQPARHIHCSGSKCKGLFIVMSTGRHGGKRQCT